MQIIDISKDILCTAIYPNDPEPKLEWFNHTERGDDYMVSTIFMCNHTGTHIDAPKHISSSEKSINETDLSLYYGLCSVITPDGKISEKHITSNRLLIRSNEKFYLTITDANMLVQSGVCLVGIDTQSIAEGEDEWLVHKILLENNIAILENLNLENVSDGEYTLCAFPLKINKAEATPVRAVLLKDN